MSPPQISVLLPAYQAEGYVGEAIESVLAQTFTDWELVISENASRDKTLEVIRSYNDPRIRLYCQERTTSAAGNWQFLFERSRGELGCVLGADDVFEPTHLEKKSALLHDFPNATFVHGAVQIIDGTGAKTWTYTQDVPREEPVAAFLARVFPGNPINGHSALLRLRRAKEAGLGFDTRYSLLMDWHFLMKLALYAGGPILYDPSATLRYRRHSQNASRLQSASFTWAMEAVELRADLLTEEREKWRALGFDTQTMAAAVIRPVSGLLFQQLRRGKWGNARRAWRLYRQVYTPADLTIDLGPYLINGLRKRMGWGAAKTLPAR
jgi:glycosyltransferase involved in cell wall biosynthesis